MNTIKKAFPWLLGAVLAPIGVFLFQHMIQTRARGGHADPLPHKGERPPGRLILPDEQVVSPEEIYKLLVEWVSPDLTRTQARPLIAQYLLATKGGKKVIDNNPVGVTADASWPGAWTMVRKATYEKGTPRHQWHAKRAYPSLRLGVVDWLDTLPETAWDAVETGSVADFAQALSDAKLITMPVNVYTKYLEDAAVAWPAEGGKAGAWTLMD